jgi:hypothetical protein
MLIRPLAQRRLLDVGLGRLDDQMLLLDPSGTPYGVATRRGPDGKSEFIVWSSGEDSKAGTPDDVCYPRNGMEALHRSGAVSP